MKDELPNGYRFWTAGASADVRLESTPTKRVPRPESGWVALPCCYAGALRQRDELAEKCAGLRRVETIGDRLRPAYAIALALDTDDDIRVENECGSARVAVADSSFTRRIAVDEQLEVRQCERLES